MHRIIASCTIAGQTVRKDGMKLFSQEMASDAGEFLLSAYTHFGFNYPRFYKMDSLSKLGWLASEILLTGTAPGGPAEGLKGHRPEEIGILLMNANASLDTDLKYFDSIKDIPSPSLFGYTLPNIMIGEICIRNHFKGENTFFITERFDAGLIEQQVNILLDQDVLKVCICGWVDLLREDYQAALFLVEKGEGNKIGNFTDETMIKIFSA